MSQNKSIDIAVIGAGISGLRSAYLLSRSENKNIKKIALFDKEETIGGVLKSTYINHFRLEHGAQGVLLNRESFLKCLQDLKIENQVILPNQKEQKRYILTPKSCVALTPNIFKLKKSGLLKFKDIFRIFLEIFIKKPDSINLNETLYSFFERRFGKKFANTFLVSLSFGIWGGGSRKLLLRYTFPKLQTLEYGYGSLMKMGFLHLCKNLFLKKKKSSPKGLASFQNGMEFLVNTLFNELKKECLKNNIELVLKLNSNVNLIKKESNFISVNFLKENNLYQEQYHCVLYSVQQWRDQNISIQSMELEKGELEKSFLKLKNIESHSIAIIGLGSSNIPENTTSIKGFGALAGEWSKDILGTIFVHSTYPSHAPTNSNLFRVLLGGDRNPLINQKSNEELIEISKLRLLETKIIDKNIYFDFTHVIKWDNYIPLATLEQDKVLEAIWKIEALVPGLFLTGNYMKGPSISDCLEQAEKVSKNILFYMDNLN